MNEYPLFPELPEGGDEEVVALVERFKDVLKKAADDVIGDLYVDIAPHIQSDAWTNFRNDLMDGLRNYRNRKMQASHDFKQIRAAIYKEFREEIIADLNQDLMEEVESLKEDLARAREWANHRG